MPTPSRHIAARRTAASRRERGVVGSFGGREPALGGCGVAPQRVDACAQQRDGGIALEQPGVVEAPQPRGGRLAAPVAAGRHGDRLEDASGAVGVACAQRVVERRFEVVVLLEPVGGTMRENGCQLGVVRGQLPVQQIAEEVVIAIPLALARRAARGRGWRFSIASSSPAECFRLEHRIAQRPAHPLQQRRPAQEREPLLAQPVQVFGVEVRRDEPVVARKRDRLGLGAVRVGRPPRRERRELECPRPALGPVQQVLDRQRRTARRRPNVGAALPRDAWSARSWVPSSSRPPRIRSARGDAALDPARDDDADPSETCSASIDTISIESGSQSTCASSTTSTDFSAAASADVRRGTTVLQKDGFGAASALSARPSIGVSPSSAAARCCSSTTGSLSRRSSVTQAKRRSSPSSPLSQERRLPVAARGRPRRRLGDRDRRAGD